LPDVGPVTAQAILAWRTEHGGFTSVDQLLDVDGIGEATPAQLAPYVTPE
jgi:competence protein ComEA